MEGREKEEEDKGRGQDEEEEEEEAGIDEEGSASSACPFEQKKFRVVRILFVTCHVTRR